MPPLVKAEDTRLITALTALSQKSPKLVKSTLYKVATEEGNSVDVRSWKMNEFKYYDVPSPFPTLARGIFTTEVTEKSDTEPQYRIVARGYDKFFNMGEVPWTTWDALALHTSAPYTLSLKSNGCIIFIAALTPSKVLITSKHSIGNLPGKEGESHAEVGERWLRKGLAQLGKTEEQFATLLWKNNWTAIAELCDDSFEEHVLGYGPELTGLHLHGINITTKNFITLPHEQVDAVAEEWGFIQTKTKTMNSIAEVKQFTDEIGKSGFWNGEAIEGFVVRTHIVASDDHKRAPPYAPGSTFFWKVKYDEPYMMYRDWRECTKRLLGKTGQLHENVVPRNKLKRAETRLYVRWCIQEIKDNKDMFKDYMQNKGIIAARDKFLVWLNSPEGQTTLAKEKKSGGSSGPVVGASGAVPAVRDAESVVAPVKGVHAFTAKKAFPKGTKTVIVPIAIPGCGKTSVSVALAHMFGFGHTQSDDVNAKKPAPVFIKNVVNLLAKHDVVIADKNNHLTVHRSSLREATSKFKPPVRLLASNWNLDMPSATIHRVCGDRIFNRGQNHQSLRADVKEKSHEDIVWQFITTRQDFSDSEVDIVVDMNLEDTLEQMVDHAVNACIHHLDVPRPSKKTIAGGVAVARGYEVKNKKAHQPTKALVASYYSFLPEFDMKATVEKTLGGVDCALWHNMKKEKRVVARPHITVIHGKTKEQESELWERCKVLHRMTPAPTFKVKASHVVWNDRVMAIAIDDLILDGEGGANQEGQEFVSKLPHDLRQRMHITVGTAQGAAAVEGQALVRSWRQNPTDATMHSAQIPGGLAMEGRVKGVFA